MAWIKRNLLFAIGSLVALALMGCAVWYLLAEMQANKDTQQKLDEAYGQLDSLSQQNIGGGKVDNIADATAQTAQLREISQKFREQFKPIPSIPDSSGSAQITSVQFATTLPVTIDQLQRAADAASVELPPQYGFSFQALRNLPRFAPGSLGPLSVQLGEVKAICDVLFAAKINSLDSICRERVSTDDDVGSATDYIEKKSVSTDMATVTPYEVTFRCFGAELSTVLSGFASSPYCFVVESLRVEPAIGSANMSMAYASPEAPVMTRNPAPSNYATTPTTLNKGGLATFLDEQQIRVTLMLEIVKLNSKR